MWTNFVNEAGSNDSANNSSGITERILEIKVKQRVLNNALICDEYATKILGKTFLARWLCNVASCAFINDFLLASCSFLAS